MKAALLKFLFFVAVLAVIVSLVMAMLATIGAVKTTEGCLYRYNLSEDGTKSINGDKVTNAVTLNANGNYTSIESNDNDGRLKEIIQDPDHYGEWLNTKLFVNKKQEIKFTVRGDISLCRAYLPINNIQSLSNLDNGNNRIPIPRIEETAVDPISFPFDAKIGEWRNIAELSYNDHVVVSVTPDQKLIQDASGGVTRNSDKIRFYDNFSKSDIGPIDCTENLRTYSPICGRYSIYSGKYVSSCEYRVDGCMCNVRKCFRNNIGPIPGGEVGDSNCENWPASMIHNWVWVPRPCSCWANIMSDAPEPYHNDGSFTHPGFGKIDYENKDINKLFTNFQPSCCSPANRPPYPESYGVGDIDISTRVGNIAQIKDNYTNKRYFWFSADNVDGLLYRFNDSPNNDKSRGGKAPSTLWFTDRGYRFAEILKDTKDVKPQSFYNPDSANPRFHIIYNDFYLGDSKSYMQYRFHSKDGEFANNTGGYVLNIKQTKCRRINGIFRDDDGAKDRGRVDYIVVSSGENPNNDTTGKYKSQNLVITDKEKGTGVINIPDSDGSQGYLWMRIYNNKDDYKDSFGKYIVQFFTSEAYDSFNIKILNWVITQFKSRVIEAATQIFKNMVCYEGDPNKDYKVTSCTNFFSYIKAILSLYIMSYGAMFLLGMVQISQTDLVIRVIKIGIVAGLMNHQTFDFFNSYVFGFITGFSDQIISNMAGYSMFSNDHTISNPFMFMDSLLTKIFMTKTFISQLLALISMGLTGILYFIIIFIALVIMLITIFRAMAIYIMAFLAIAVLIGLTPLFLTFMLFDFTRYLFDNWVRFTFRYMIEPVVLMAGIIILTQLFTIYLDFAVGYSVCWKCALPIKLPFPSIPGFNPAFANIELFCINWFAPWGFDHRSGMIGLNMQHVIALIIISYCIYGYSDLSSKMVVKLANTGGPSATQMGNAASSWVENKGLEKIGLDKKSREKIKQGIKQRLDGRKSAIKKGRKAGNKSGDAKSAPKPSEYKPDKDEEDDGESNKLI